MENELLENLGRLHTTELGDGYYIKDNECVKLKTSICSYRGGLSWA